MSFLNKIQKPAGTTPTVATAKPNPFARPNPFAKKPEESKEETSSESTAVDKKKTLPFDTPAKTEEVKKPNPFAMPKKKAEEPAQEAPAKEETAAPVKEEIKEETTPEVKNMVETQETEHPKKDPVEPTKDPGIEVDPKKETSEEQSHPKSRKRGSRNSKKGNETPNPEVSKETLDDTTEDEPYSMPTTSMNYAEAVSSIKSPFVDEEWEAFRVNTQRELDAIIISADMNSAVLKKTISDLSILRQKVWMFYQDTRSLYDSLSSEKPEGLIERIKKIAFGKEDKNDMERKKVGVEACMSYASPDGVINLYEVLDETRSRYNFLRAVMDSIQWKTDSLITMNGAIKLEKNHITNEA
jgi:hypothetical protein